MQRLMREIRSVHGNRVHVRLRDGRHLVLKAWGWEVVPRPRRQQAAIFLNASGMWRRAARRLTGENRRKLLDQARKDIVQARQMRLCGG